MTALCGGGASQAKPGVGELVIVTSGAIALALETAGRGWLRPLLALLALPPYETFQLCASDPPGFQPMTAAEVYAAVAQLGITPDVLAAKQKLGDNLATYAWYALCECVSVATPAPPAVTIVQPDPLPLPAVQPNTSPCLAGTTADSPVQAGSFQWTNTISFAGINATALQLVMTRTSVGVGPHEQNTYQLVWLDKTTPVPATLSIVDLTPNASVATFNFPIPANAVKFKVNTTAPNNSTDTLRIAWNFYCNAPPGQVPGVACCPPDPQLLAIVTQILDTVTLIQRQKAPFAYVPGVRHNGLTGNGQLAVQGLIGVSVIITTLPAYLGNLAGDPPELFDVGWLTVGTADGWQRSVRIDHNPTLVLPIEGSETLVGYTLHPGVVVDVLELKREP